MLPRRIVFFGSSTIYGTADSEMGGFVNRLRLWHESLDEQNRVYSLGVWGEQTPELIERIVPEAKARRPHLILIYPGFNDIRRTGSRNGTNATNLEEFAALMHKLLSVARFVAPTAVMTGYPFDESRTQPFQGTNSFYCMNDALDYTKRLVDVANSLGVKVLDFFRSFKDTDMIPLLAADGLHGNSECHRQLFEITKRFIQTECFTSG